MRCHARDAAPDGRMLLGIRGVRLAPPVDAKIKDDDHNSVERRERVTGVADDSARLLRSRAAVGLAVAAMLSLQLGSALPLDLIATVVPALRRCFCNRDGLSDRTTTLIDRLRFPLPPLRKSGWRL